MTAYSLRILQWPAGVTKAELERGVLEAPILQSLSAYADQCGPYGLSAWAKPRGHRLHYVDNCWVRAEVTGREVEAFLKEVLRDGPGLAPSIVPEGRYLIEAEEY